MKWKVAAVVLLLAVGLGTAGYVVIAPGGNARSQSQYLTAAVSRGDVTQQVVATGSVRSAATYNLAFGSDPVLSTSTASSSSSSSASSAAASSASANASSSGSWLVTKVEVGVGDSVASGEVLATADTASAKAALEVAKANLAVAKAKLAVDQGGLTGAERAAAYDSIRQAQQQLKVAKVSQSQTSDQNDLKLAQAKAALAKAQQQLVDDQTAGPPSATISADQASITQIQQQIDTLNLQIQGAQAEAGVSNQQNQLKLTQAQSTLSAAQQRLATDQAQLASDTSKLNADTASHAAQSVIDADNAAIAADNAAIKADQSAVDQAQQQLDTLNLQIQAANTQSGTTDQQNQLKLQQLQASLATAQQKLADDQAAGPAESTIKADQSAIDQAQQQLDTLKLTIASSVTSAANQLASAELSLSSSQHNYSMKVAPADAATIANDKASVSTATTAVNDARDTLARYSLKSPVDGVVTAVNVVAGATAPSSADITVASRQMEVSATVTETDYPSLKVGQAVSVKITALDTTATGSVKEIDPVGSSSGTGGVVSYPIVVTIDPVPAGTASGMSADIEVTIAQKTGVLSVPATALNGSSGNYTVMVMGADGVPTAQAVEVGLVTSSLAEITSGLTEGETVVTGINATRTGTATTGGGLGGGGLGFPVGGGGGGVFRPGN